MRVLVVEDQAKLATVVAAGLRRAGMAVDVVFDGADALEHTASTEYDVVVLDRDLPGVHGDETSDAFSCQAAWLRVALTGGGKAVASS